MRIALVTPVAAGSSRGNGVTARRWAEILRDLGHQVQLCSLSLGDAAADLAVVLHARKGAVAVAQAEERGIPVVLALTGTDLYADLPDDPVAQTSCRLAWRLVALQDLAAGQLPPELRDRVRVIYQSVKAQPLQPSQSNAGVLRICCLAHLRAVKDPLLPGRALARLDPDLGLMVELAGELLEQELEAPLQQLSVAEPRFAWLGALAPREARDLLSRSQALVVPSRMEGGANVISEAAVHGLPVLASDIPGNRGLLGPDHPGYFAPGDAAQLADLYLRMLEDRGFCEELAACSRKLQPKFRPERERDSWRALLAEL